ncbi:hypothetical protein QJQ45_009768, partial [Haematococcus lacustris]
AAGLLQGGVRPRGEGQRRGRVVLVDEHRTTRVSSAANGQQPCEEQLDHEQPTRHANWKPSAGPVEHRLLRPAWSQQHQQPVRGMMWCLVVAPRKPPQPPGSSQEAPQPEASDPEPSTPPPAKRRKRTKAEQAAEPTQPTKGKGQGKGKAAPQPGRWLDRDCNAAWEHAAHWGEQVAPTGAVLVVGMLAPIHPSAGEQHTYTRKSLQGILHSPSSVALDAKKHMFNQFFEADVPLPSPSGRWGQPGSPGSRYAGSCRSRKSRASRAPSQAFTAPGSPLFHSEWGLRARSGASGRVAPACGPLHTAVQPAGGSAAAERQQRQALRAVRKAVQAAAAAGKHAGLASTWQAAAGTVATQPSELGAALRVADQADQADQAKGEGLAEAQGEVAGVPQWSHQLALRLAQRGWFGQQVVELLAAPRLQSPAAALLHHACSLTPGVLDTCASRAAALLPLVLGGAQGQVAAQVPAQASIMAVPLPGASKPFRCTQDWHAGLRAGAVGTRERVAGQPAAAQAAPSSPTTTRQCGARAGPMAVLVGEAQGRRSVAVRRQGLTLALALSRSAAGRASLVAVPATCSLLCAHLQASGPQGPLLQQLAASTWSQVCSEPGCCLWVCGQQAVLPSLCKAAKAAAVAVMGGDAGGGSGGGEDGRNAACLAHCANPPAGAATLVKTHKVLAWALDLVPALAPAPGRPVGPALRAVLRLLDELSCHPDSEVRGAVLSGLEGTGGYSGALGPGLAALASCATSGRASLADSALAANLLWRAATGNGQLKLRMLRDGNVQLVPTLVLRLTAVQQAAVARQWQALVPPPSPNPCVAAAPAPCRPSLATSQAAAAAPPAAASGPVEVVGIGAAGIHQQLSTAGLPNASAGAAEEELGTAATSTSPSDSDSDTAESDARDTHSDSSSSSNSNSSSSSCSSGRDGGGGDVADSGQTARVHTPPSARRCSRLLQQVHDLLVAGLGLLSSLAASTSTSDRAASLLLQAGLPAYLHSQLPQLLALQPGPCQPGFAAGVEVRQQALTLVANLCGSSQGAEAVRLAPGLLQAVQGCLGASLPGAGVEQWGGRQQQQVWPGLPSSWDHSVSARLLLPAATALANHLRALHSQAPAAAPPGAGGGRQGEQQGGVGEAGEQEAGAGGGGVELGTGGQRAGGVAAEVSGASVLRVCCAALAVLLAGGPEGPPQGAGHPTLLAGCGEAASKSAVAASSRVPRWQLLQLQQVCSLCDTVQVAARWPGLAADGNAGGDRVPASPQVEQASLGLALMLCDLMPLTVSSQGLAKGHADQVTAVVVAGLQALTLLLARGLLPPSTLIHPVLPALRLGLEAPVAAEHPRTWAAAMGLAQVLSCQPGCAVVLARDTAVARAVAGLLRDKVHVELVEELRRSAQLGFPAPSPAHIGMLQVDRIAARDVSGEELLGRLRLCEDALSAINHEKLSPFNQQQILQRLDTVEAQAAATQASVTAFLGSSEGQPAAEASTEVPDRPGSGRLGAGGHGSIEQRLQGLEDKLVGVYNLNGKLIALDQIAADLGVDIPDTSLHPPDPDALHLASQGELVAPAGSEGGLAAAGGVVVGPPPVDLGAGEGLWPSVGLLPGVARTRSGSSPNTGMRIGDVVAQVAVLAAEAQATKHLISSLQGEIGSLTSSTSTQQEELGDRVAVLETSAVHLREHLLQEISAVQRGQQREPEVSFAAFTALGSRVDAAQAEAGRALEAVRELRDKQVAPLLVAVSDLKDQAGGCLPPALTALPALPLPTWAALLTCRLKLRTLRCQAQVKVQGEPRDMDTLFHTRLAKLESAVGDIKHEVQLAVGDVLEDVAKVSDLASLEEALESRASQADLRQLALQQANLAQSMNGIAEWLAVRPETSDGIKGIGASVTRFKCLTCDREIKGQGLGHSSGPEAKARGSFLPKLEPLAGGHAGAPVGPGINVAEARRLVEEKLTGHLSPNRKSSPLRGTDGDTQGQDEPASNRARATSARTALPMTNSALVPKAAPGIGRTPVFL